MVCKPFELQRNAANDLRTRRRRAAGQRLNHLRIGRGMPDGRVAGQRFGVMNAAQPRSADQRFFNTAVLISQRNFKVKHLFAMALETKMSRLNHTGMHRPDRDLMGLFAGHAIKITHARHNRLSGHTIPGITSLAPRRTIPHRFEPRMMLRMQPVLFCNLTFKKVHLRTLRRQRFIPVAFDRGTRHMNPVLVIIGQNHIKIRALRFNCVVGIQR